MSFFVITNNIFDDTQFAFGEQKETNYATGDAEFCKECGSYTSMLKWLPPYQLSISKKNLGDFIFGSFVGFIVSKKFKDKFEKTNLSGLSYFKKVELYHDKVLLNEDYYYPQITQINAFIDLELIEFDDEELCDECQKGRSIISRINGIIFKNQKIINEDIFFTTAIGQSVIIISSKFKEFLIKEEFTNIKYIEAARYKWDSFNPIEY